MPVPSDTEVMARAILKAIQRLNKRRPMEAVTALTALGVAGAFVTAGALPEANEAADALAIGCLGTGYLEMLPTLRKLGAN